MAGLESKSFSSPDETRPFKAKGHIDVVNIGGVSAMRGVFEPGWKWSEHVKPLAKTDSCQAVHTGYMVSGRMKIAMDDGSERDLRAGDAVYIPAGHDAWIVGNEACEFIDFGPNAGQYAKPG